MPIICGNKETENGVKIMTLVFDFQEAESK